MAVDNEKDGMESDPKFKKDKKKKKSSNPDINLEPELEEERQPLSIQQRKQRARTMRRFGKKIARARERKMNRKATEDQLKGRARKQAIKQVRSKVAGDKGSDYANLTAAEKSMIDKKVAKRAPAVQRMTKKLLPKVRKMEKERRRGKRFSVNEEFVSLFEASIADTKPKKRFHELMTKDGKVKHDKRFRFNKKEPVKEDLDTLRKQHNVEKERLAQQQERERDRIKTRRMRQKIRKINTEDVDEYSLYNIIDFIYEEMEQEDAKMEAALTEKAEKSGYLLETIEEVYNRGLDNWQESYDLEPEQYAMNRVNSFINEGRAYKLDKDLLEGTVSIQQAISAIHRQVERGMSLIDASWEVSRARGVNMNAKALAKAYTDKYDEPKTSNMRVPSASQKKLYKKYGFRLGEEVEELEEKAVSKSQQRLMGMALAYKRGETDDVSDEVKKVANSMSEKDLEDYASTKHKGKPEKVEEEIELDEGKILDMIRGWSQSEIQKKVSALDTSPKQF